MTTEQNLIDSNKKPMNLFEEWFEQERPKATQFYSRNMWGQGARRGATR